MTSKPQRAPLDRPQSAAQPTDSAPNAAPNRAPDRAPNRVGALLAAQASNDRLIHERIRLGIVSALAVTASLTFKELKSLLHTTDGNLCIHARKLEASQLHHLRQIPFRQRWPLRQNQLSPHRHWTPRPGALPRSHGSPDPRHPRPLVAQTPKVIVIPNAGGALCLQPAKKIIKRSATWFAQTSEESSHFAHTIPNRAKKEVVIPSDCRKTINPARCPTARNLLLSLVRSRTSQFRFQCRQRALSSGSSATTRLFAFSDWVPPPSFVGCGLYLHPAGKGCGF